AIVPVTSLRLITPAGVLNSPSIAAGNPLLLRSTTGCGATPDTLEDWFSVLLKLNVPASSIALLIVTTVLPWNGPLFGAKLLVVMKTPLLLTPRSGSRQSYVLWDSPVWKTPSSPQLDRWSWTPQREDCWTDWRCRPLPR